MNVIYPPAEVEGAPKGAVVLGVSTDSAKSHDKFVEKFKLPFTLLVDDGKKIVQAYGVWGPKTFMGVRYTGTSRVTFLITRAERNWVTSRASAPI